MILADTSVWVDHLRRGNAALGALLEQGQVAGHPFVIGEVALGYLKKRAEVLSLLRDLPAVLPVEHEDVLRFVADHDLVGSGLGWVDAHLLAAAALDHSRLWTLDRRLAAAAARLGLEHQA